MKDALHLVFDGLERPIALVDCRHLIDHFPLVFPGWRIEASTEKLPSPILTLRLDKSTYTLQAEWLKQPLCNTDEVDAICGFVAELLRAYVKNDSNLLCLHGAAAVFAGKLVVFPSKYRAGKSVLSACLAAANIQIFSDDALPVSVPEGHGISPGLALRLRIPLPENLNLESKNFIESHRGLEGKQYLYLDLNNNLLAARGSIAPVGAFVLLEREEGAVPTLEDISEAEVLHQVVWQNFAREAEAPQILGRLSQLVASAGRYRMRYDRAEDAVAFLQGVFKEWPSEVAEESSTQIVASQNGVNPAVAPPGCYLRKAEISVVSVDGESFLADAQGAAIHHLNSVGAAIWTLLAEPVSMAEMVELMLTVFPDEDSDRVKSDLAALIDTLISKNLLHTG